MVTVAGKLDLKPLITHTFSLSDVNKAFDVVLNREEHKAMKVAVLP